MVCLQSAINRYDPAWLALVLCPVSLGKLRAPQGQDQNSGSILHPCPLQNRELTFHWALRSLSQHSIPRWIHWLRGWNWPRGRAADSWLGEAGGRRAQREAWLRIQPAALWTLQPCCAQLSCCVSAKQGDISCGRGYCQAKGRAGESRLSVLPGCMRLQAGSAGERVPCAGWVRTGACREQQGGREREERSQREGAKGMEQLRARTFHL